MTTTLCVTSLIFGLLASASAQSLETCIESALGHNTLLYAFDNFQDITDLAYELTDVHPYNLDYPWTPTAVTYPTTNKQAADVVSCAKQFNRTVQARSGGHSYQNYCLGGKDGAVVVDTKNFDFFNYHVIDQTVTFGAGIRLGKLTELLKSVDRVMTYGVSADVGSGGHITIGGLGTMGRQLGLALDQVVSMECILANGTVATASNTSNVDLFWALRGAGASFAIVTSFAMVTSPPATAMVINYNVTAGSIADLADAWYGWQQYVSQPNLTRLFGCTITLIEGVLLFQGIYYGNAAEVGELNLEAIFSSISPSIRVTSSIVTKSVFDIIDFVQDVGSGIPAHFYAKSLKYTNTTLMTAAAARQMFEYIDQADKGTLAWFIIWDLGGGRIADYAQDATAYWHRDALFFMQSYVIDLNPFTSTVNAASKAFLNGLNQKIQSVVPGIDDSAYPGYVDDALGEGAQVDYLGGNVLRLESVKREYDPDNVLWNPQSIKVAADE